MKLLTVGGVGFRVHLLFVLLLFALAWTGRGVEALVVFGVVLAHELAHVAAAKGCGLVVREVELLPFGGVARLEGLMETDPSVEAAVAWAGPATNVALIGLGLLAWRLQALPDRWAWFFIGANVAVAAVNLLPALPLDGGRLYRAYRSRRVGFRRATAEAVRLGRALGVCMTAAGAALLYAGIVSVTLPVLGVVIYVAAGREDAAAAYMFMAHLSRKRQDMARHGCMAVETLAARESASVKQVLERFMPQKYHVVWIVDEDGRLAGVASEGEVLEALFERGPELPLREVARWRFIDRK